MVKHAFVTAVVVAGLIAPLHADTKFTIHTEQAPPESGAPQDNLSNLVGGMMGQLLPAGGVDDVFTVGDKATRIDHLMSYGGFKAGTSQLIFADGRSFLIDPSTRTYTKQSIGASTPEMAQLGGLKPDIQAQRTGDTQTIDGKPCERVLVTIVIPFPAGMPVPQGFPTEFKGTIDLWTTDAVKVPAAVAATTLPLVSQLGLVDVKNAIGDRFVMKAVVRLMGINVTVSARDVATVTSPPGTFEIPADYKEIVK